MSYGTTRGRVIRAIVFIAFAMMAVFGMKSWSKLKAAKDIRAEGFELIKGIPDYAQNSEALDKYFAIAHKKAFDLAYTTGGKRQKDTFDGDAYIGYLLGVMGQIAKREDDIPSTTAIRLFAISREIRVRTLTDL